MHVKRLMFVAMFTLALFPMVLGACSQKSTEQPSEKPTGVIPQAQLDALNKAKNVETVLKQGELQRHEQTEAAQ